MSFYFFNWKRSIRHLDQSLLDWPTFGLFPNQSWFYFHLRPRSELLGSLYRVFLWFQLRKGPKWFNDSPDIQSVQFIKNVIIIIFFFISTHFSLISVVFAANWFLIEFLKKSPPLNRFLHFDPPIFVYRLIFFNG